MDNINLTLGSVKARDVLKDGISFGRRNYGKLLKITLPLFAAMLLYCGLVFGIIWFSINTIEFPGSEPLRIFLTLLNIPISLAGAFIMSILMVSVVRRINSEIRGEELTLKESFKGSAVTALKIYGISMLGAMIIYIPMVIFIPAGVIVGSFVSFSGQIAVFIPVIIILILLILTVFFIIFIIWAFYVGIHIITLVLTVIIDPKVNKWMNWARGLVKGRVSNIAGVMSAIYGVYFIMILVFGIPAVWLNSNVFMYPMISSIFVLVISLFLYPFFFSILIILYYRMKSANWDKISGILANNKSEDVGTIAERDKDV